MDLPSLLEVFEGIMMEAREHLRLHSRCAVGTKGLLDAQNNICATWREMLNLVKDFDPNLPLTYEILMDPTHPVTRLLLRVYSMETFLYGTLNQAIRFADSSKIDSLGPYDQAMFFVLGGSGENREDLDEKNFRNLNLYRGTSLTLA